MSDSDPVSPVDAGEQGPVEVVQFSRFDGTWGPGLAAEEGQRVKPAPLRFPPPPPLPQRELPVQSAVDRRQPLSPTFVDVKVMAGGKVIQVLRYPEFGPYGPSPQDPAWYAAGVPANAICATLAPYARANCVARAGGR